MKNNKRRSDIKRCQGLIPGSVLYTCKPYKRITENCYRFSFTIGVVVVVATAASLATTTSLCGKNLRCHNKIAITPTEIEASARLNTGLKNSNSSPPHTGNQDG